MTLNGWQRLWVVLAVVWLVPIAVLGYRNVGINYGMERSLQAKLTAVPSNTIEFEYSDVWGYPQTAHLRPPKVGERRTVDGGAIGVWDGKHLIDALGNPMVIEADIPGVGTVHFPSFMSLKEMELIAATWYTAHESTTKGQVAAVRDSRRRLFISYSLWFVLPLVAIYALGVGVAWIRRGFRQQDPA